MARVSSDNSDVPTGGRRDQVVTLVSALRTVLAAVRRRLFPWPRSARHARGHARVAAVMLWTALIIVFATGPGNRSVTGPIKGTDFLYFYTNGYLVRTHQAEKLYDIRALHSAQVTVVPESQPEVYPPVYPPQIGLFFAPLTVFSFHTALLLWISFTAIVFAFIVRSTWRPVERWLPDRSFVLWAAACFPPFWNLILHGQITVLIVLAFWAGWIALERGKPFVAGCAFGLLAIKPQFALPLAAVALACRQWSMIVGAAVAVGIQLAAVIAFIGASALQAYASVMPFIIRNADVLEPRPYHSHSLRAIISRLAPAWAGVPLWVATSAIVVAFCIRTWRSTPEWRVRMSVLILASVLVNPHLIIYDAAVLALPLIWIAAYLAEVSRPEQLPNYGMLVYWLFVTLLAPTAAVVPIQVSVLLMLAIFYTVVRTVLSASRVIVSPGVAAA